MKTVNLTQSFPTRPLSRAERLKRIERQINLADFQRTSYGRTMQRAEAEEDAPRAAEYAARLAEAEAAAEALRMEWMKIKLDVCERATGEIQGSKVRQ